MDRAVVASSRDTGDKDSDSGMYGKQCGRLDQLCKAKDWLSRLILVSGGVRRVAEGPGRVHVAATVTIL